MPWSHLAQRSQILCGKFWRATKIIPNVRVIDHAVGYELDLNVEVDEDPGARLERKPHYGKVRARLCASCGHAELFVADAGALWDSYQRSLSGSTYLGH